MLLTGVSALGQASVQKEESIMTMKGDLGARAHEINWPQEFNPATADLFAHNELVLSASCEQVWQHIVDASEWPQWYPNAKEVKFLNGAKNLGEGVVWRWTTFGFAIESRINEFIPHSRIGWFGYKPGTPPSFYHTWYLKPERHSCRVVTEEVGIGPAARQLRETKETLLHRGHDLWLATLKWVVESR